MITVTLLCIQDGINLVNGTLKWFRIHLNKERRGGEGDAR